MYHPASVVSILSCNIIEIYTLNKLYLHSFIRTKIFTLQQKKMSNKTVELKNRHHKQNMYVSRGIWQ